jgi:transposase
MKAKELKSDKRSHKKIFQLYKEAIEGRSFRVSRRLHAILLNLEGYTAPQIANILKVHRTNVSSWLRNWEAGGLQGVLEGYRPGRPCSITPYQIQRLEDILDSGPIAYGFNTGIWTSPMVARVIEDEFSVAYHPAHVSKILHHLGFSVQRPRKILARADQEKQSRWVRYTYPNIKKKPKQKELS